MAESSSSHVEKLLPYQFQPMRDPSDDAEDSDGWETVEEDSDVEERLVAETRSQREANEWCVCGNCQRMQTTLECVCCKEMYETKSMVEKAGLG